ncbi:MAG: hypothetical protein JW709_05890 [Sedimentisphaerales bacterium]|nr:hypothetical protein [Sedimentisphaerales bacterium]
MNFCFTKVRVEHWEEKVGFDVRPVIEMKLDRPHLMEFGNLLTDKYPNLYESLVQSPNEFLAKKRFVFPGKGEAELLTLAIPPRGPVFIFPHILCQINEELDLPPTEEIVLDCVKIFQDSFKKTRKVARIGLINEYIFSTGGENSTTAICKHFTKLNVPSHGEVFLKFNQPCEKYNRLISIEPLTKTRIAPIGTIQDEAQVAGYGIKVTVDFNNRNIDKDLSRDDFLVLLHDAKKFNDGELYNLLNNPSGE